MSRYIDAEDVKLLLWGYTNGDVELLKKIDKIESKDVAPVIHAHWDNHMKKDFLYDHGPDYELVEDGYECSNCNHYEDFETNYCSNCGAKMDEPER